MLPLSRLRGLFAVVGPATLFLAAAAPALAQRGKSQAAMPDSGAWTSLRYRHIGPEGNRVSAVTGVAGDRRIYYVGAAAGGVWKTTDGGNRWTPVFDGQSVQSIGALAVAPSDPNVVWVGTGEAFIRSHVSIGNGVYKSTDAGKTWKYMGLEATGRIGRVTIHPTNPDIVYVAALGRGYGPQPERGVYRSTDGGASWQKVLFVNDSTGAADVILDPSNPRTLYASMWQLEIRTWGRVSGGRGSGIYRSTDGGDNWTRLEGKGLPDWPVGKISVAISPADPRRVYALIEAGDGNPFGDIATKPGKLWRSDDGGESWRMVNPDRELGGRGAYYTRMAVSPDDPDEAYFLTASFTKTLDGGLHTVDIPFQQAPGWDHHDMWIDPTDGERMIVGFDGGIAISEDRGRSWRRIALPIAQMYHVTVDNRVPYWVFGNRQDGPSIMGPSNNRAAGFLGPGQITRGEWRTVGGGESGWATPDTVDDNLIWSSASGWGSVGGIVTIYNRETRQTRNVEVWPDATIGHAARDVKYRFIWNFPLTISPHDRNRVYVGSQYVHVTRDRGQTWGVISPDLTRNDTTRMGPSGGLTPDNIGVEYAGTVFSIAESPVQPGVLWAGTNDGLIHISRDGGATWSDVTRNLPGLPEWLTISHIEPSRWDAGTAYVAIDGHQNNNRDPWLYKTTDYGRTWRLIVDGIPKSPLSYTHIIREDPVRRGLLYAGTENAVYVSFDDGAHWQPLQNNLPHAPVYGMVVQPHFNDLVIATYGRGFWILDDITPLQQLTPEIAASEAHLFVPRPAWRFRMVEPVLSVFDDPAVGENPPYGASLHYWLKSKSEDSVTIRIADAGGRVVRELKGPANAGINRVWWDLREERTSEARLRTAPLYAPYVTMDTTGWRAAPDAGRMAILAPPGRYTVTLVANGREYTQPLEVRKDPHSAGTEETIGQQMELLRDLRADLETGVQLVNAMELVRGQLQGLVRTLAADSTVAADTGAVASNADLRAAADSLEQRFTALESHLVQLRLTGRGQDQLRWPMKLAAKILYLAEQVGSSDDAPTAAQLGVHRLFHAQLEGIRADYDALIARDLAQFNERLRARGAGGVAVPGYPARGRATP